jgi:hypothetical protein
MRPLTTLFAALACIVVGVSASACTSNSSAKHTPSSSSSTVASTTGTTDSGSAAVSPTTAGPTQSAYDRVQAWYDGVATHFAAIQDITGAIKDAAGASNVAALPNLCGQLRHDVTVVDSDPAPPDKLMAAAVIASMNAYSDAARSCLAGDYGAAATGINKGAVYLDKANQIMNNLS